MEDQVDGVPGVGMGYDVSDSLVRRIGWCGIASLPNPPVACPSIVLNYVGRIAKSRPASRQALQAQQVVESETASLVGLGFAGGCPFAPRISPRRTASLALGHCD
jgi:hypothetical protein